MYRLIAVSVALLMVVGCGSANVASTLDWEDQVGSSTTVATVASTTTAEQETLVTSVSPPTSSTALRPSTTSTSTPITAPVLTATGIGSLRIGVAEQIAMDRLVEYFGPPSFEDLYEAPFGEEGEFGSGPTACHQGTVGWICFEYIKFVLWDDPSFLVVVADYNRTDGGQIIQARPNLRGYTYGGSTETEPLFTEAGITVGSSLAALQEAYGEAVSFGEGCGSEFDHYSVANADGSAGIFGGLAEDPGVGGTIVRSIGVGARSSC